MPRIAWLVTLAAIVSGVSALSANAQDPPPDKQEKQSGWQKLFRKQAAGYKFNVEGHEEAEVKLVAEPILHWSQPVRGGADGAVFLWTQGGRPVAIGTFFIWPMHNGRQGISHELHSLSVTPLVATWKDRKWTPPKDSLKAALGGKTVWEVDRAGFDNPRVAYYCSTVESRTSPDGE